MLAHRRFDRLEVGGVDHHQRAAAGGGAGHAAEAAGQPAVDEAGVVRTPVGELPAQDRRVEALGRLQVGGRELDVVDASVVLCLAHP